MDMQGSRQLTVTQQQAWEALNDPEVLKTCIPGCESVEPTGDNAFTLVNAFKVGPVAAKFKGTITLTDIEAPNRYTLNFDGNGGAAGFGKGSAKVSLAPKGEGCQLDYTANATVGGKLAQVGQRLVDGVAKSMANKFFQRFDEEMQRRHPGTARDTAAGTPARATAEAPPDAGAMARFWQWLKRVFGGGAAKG